MVEHFLPMPTIILPPILFLGRKIGLSAYKSFIRVWKTMKMGELTLYKNKPKREMSIVGWSIRKDVEITLNKDDSVI